ncbi:MAG: hypothetical protein HY791_19010 [Deltaproteobacteria bacterium]|nr:hypothetical protein [Deltaproteobacteria bacterium]
MFALITLLAALLALSAFVIPYYGLGWITLTAYRLILRARIAKLGFSPRGLVRYDCRAVHTTFELDRSVHELSPSESARIRAHHGSSLELLVIKFAVSPAVPADWTFHATVLHRPEISGSEPVALAMLGALSPLRLLDGERLALSTFDESPELELDVRGSRLGTGTFSACVYALESIAENLERMSVPGGLLEAALGAGSDELRAMATAALLDAYPESREAAALRRDGKSSDSPAVRFEVARSTHPADLEVMKDLAADRFLSDQLREQALLHIARATPRSVSVPIVVRALEDGSASVAWSILDEIARQRWTEAVPSLIRLAPPNPHVAERLATTLGELREAAAIPKLLSFLAPDSPYDSARGESARIAAIDALARLAGNEVVPRLRELTSAATARERRALELAISTIHAKQPGDDHGLALAGPQGGELSLDRDSGELSIAKNQNLRES